MFGQHSNQNDYRSHNIACSRANKPIDLVKKIITDRNQVPMVAADGNPLEDIRVLETPDENLVVIMKDGKIYKNKL